MQNEIEGRNNEIVQHEDLTEKLSNANEEIRILKEQNESLKNELDIQKQANERMMKSQTDLDQLNEQNLHKQKGKAGLGYNEEGESSEQGSQRNQRPTCNYCGKTSHRSNKCWSNGKTRFKGKCYSCNQHGHKASECKENEHQMTLRFHTFLVLSKQIEAIVNNATIMWKRIYNLPMPSDPMVTIEGDKDDEEDEEKKEEEEAVEEEEDTVIIGDEEDDPEQVATEVIASLPHSPQKGVASSASASRIVSTVATSIAQSLPITSQLQTPIVTSSTELQSMSLSTEMQSVASTEQQVTSSVTEITTSPTACIVSFATSPVLTHSLAQMITPISTPACTSILGTVGTSTSLPLVNPIPVITATPTLSTIVTTSKDKEVSTEVIQKTPLKLLLTGKAIEDDIDLDKEIVIPQIDLNTASIDEMRLISQLLEQKAKQKQLRSERDREFNIINGAKTILTDALGIKVDPSQHILLQLEEAVNRFNEDSSGEEKLIERTEKKFDNKVLEHIAQQIAIKQVELTTILAKLENSFNNVTSFFAKLCDVTEFTKGIRDQLKKIDDDLKASAQQLQLDPSSSSTHHSNIRFLLDKQSELLREDARIRSTLLDIQNMILPNMDTMQKHITHSKTLIHDNNFSVAEHVIELSAKVQVALSICTILQENWDKTLAHIKQVHSEFISHFNISI
ncbi:hypothetical protein SUGI_0617070 [Cryptomeria japonica]|nr:hypothetical protein SUGI_0617070 [Cryptomeria japonica]